MVPEENALPMSLLFISVLIIHPYITITGIFKVMLAHNKTKTGIIEPDIVDVGRVCGTYAPCFIG